MALGAVTINHRDNEGDGVTIAGQCTLTSGANYVVGGSVLNASDLGLNQITAVICDNLTFDGATLVSVDRSGLLTGPVTSVKFKAYSALTPTEVSVNTNLSAAGKTVGFEIQGY